MHSAKQKPTTATADKPLTFGELPDGWTREGWIRHLRQMADSCCKLHPLAAQSYEEWAAKVEAAKGEDEV